MIGNSEKLFLGGLFAGAVAIAVFAWRPGSVEHARDQPAIERYDTALPETDDNAPSGSTTSGAIVSGHSDSQGITRILQAIRDSLQRGDLASAKVLLRAARTLHSEDDQVLALQRELDAREPANANPSPAMQANKSAFGPGETRAPSRLSKNDRAKTTVRQTKEPAAIKPRDVPAFVAPEVVAAPGNAARGEGATTVVENDHTATPPPLAMTSAPLSAPQPAVQPLPAQTAVPAVQTARADKPKSRAEVRAELDQARESGEIPRFGNPNPSGPGGSPGLTPPPPVALGGNE